MAEQNDNELVEEIWAPPSFVNVFFSPQESQAFLDSFLVDGVPPPELDTGNARWILDRLRTRREILTATPEQLRNWCHR